jgi:hypothetical protein
MHALLGAGRQMPTLAFFRKVGKLLYRTRLGFIAFFLTIACGGESESTQSVATQATTSGSAAVTEQHVKTSEPIVVDMPSVEKVLPAVSAGGRKKSPDTLSKADIELRAALNWALLEYRAAFVGRNMVKLEGIWKMGAVERLLIKKAWASCEKIELSLETQEMRVTGRSAVVDFDQELTFLCPNESRTSHSTLAANLNRSKAGVWTIARIGDRVVAPTRMAQAGPARIAPRGGEGAVDTSMNRALETLSDYELALQQCDLDGLSRVWIMSELERQILQGLCFRSGQLDVSISEPQISRDDGKVSINFTHDFTKQGRTGPTQTRSRLTALFVEREDGNLAIWKIRSAE